MEYKEINSQANQENNQNKIKENKKKATKCLNLIALIQKKFIKQEVL